MDGLVPEPNEKYARVSDYYEVKESEVLIVKNDYWETRILAKGG